VRESELSSGPELNDRNQKEGCYGVFRVAFCKKMFQGLFEITDKAVRRRTIRTG